MSPLFQRHHNAIQRSEPYRVYQLFQPSLQHGFIHMGAKRMNSFICKDHSTNGGLHLSTLSSLNCAISEDQNRSLRFIRRDSLGCPELTRDKRISKAALDVSSSRMFFLWCSCLSHSRISAIASLPCRPTICNSAYWTLPRMAVSWSASSVPLWRIFWSSATRSCFRDSLLSTLITPCSAVSTVTPSMSVEVAKGASLSLANLKPKSSKSPSTQACVDATWLQWVMQG